MKQLLLITICILSFLQADAQNKMAAASYDKEKLSEIHKCIATLQDSSSLLIENLANHSMEHDVNSIILDIEKYIDSLPKNKTRADILLNKYFAPLRLFFLTTTNNTTVATSFLYTDVPYKFCRYNDTALALLLGAVKDGNTYDLAKKTERRIAKAAMETCLLPSLKALDEFKDGELKYVGVSIYYGCKDTREGAPSEPITPFCMTLVARLGDIQQYNAGLITAKGLLTTAEVYLSDADAHELRRIQMNMD